MRILLDLVYRAPGLNLALDEAILREVARGKAEPTLRVWRNPRCVVVGRGQRIEDEADLVMCARLGIPVLKRPSGGGAVVHHPGNLNFSLFLPLTGRWTAVRQSQECFTRLLASALQQRLGIAAEPREGAIFVAKAKVSGSAQLRRRALLHHGTLLFAPDAIAMEDLLLSHRPGYAPQGVPSRPAAVGDLSSLTGRAVTIEEAVRIILAAFRPLGRTGLGAISPEE